MDNQPIDTNMVPSNNNTAYGDTGGQAGNEQQAFSSSTVTITQTATTTENSTIDEDILSLTLRARPQVTWDQNVIDNEGLGRKSSKRCCIFHKQREFDESSTDSSDDNHSDDSESSSSSGGGFPSERRRPKKKKDRRKIARPKQGGKKVPDAQRYHA